MKGLNQVRHVPLSEVRWSLVRLKRTLVRWGSAQRPWSRQTNKEPTVTAMRSSHLFSILFVQYTSSVDELSAISIVIKNFQDHNAKWI